MVVPDRSPCPTCRRCPIAARRRASRPRAALLHLVRAIQAATVHAAWRRRAGELAPGSGAIARRRE
eukprot:6212576-Pleurochrysis_carterae.AAC.2